MLFTSSVNFVLGKSSITILYLYLYFLNVMCCSLTHPIPCFLGSMGHIYIWSIHHLINVPLVSMSANSPPSSCWISIRCVISSMNSNTYPWKVIRFKHFSAIDVVPCLSTLPIHKWLYCYMVSIQTTFPQHQRLLLLSNRRISPRPQHFTITVLFWKRSMTQISSW